MMCNAHIISNKPRQIYPLRHIKVYRALLRLKKKYYTTMNSVEDKIRN